MEQISVEYRPSRVRAVFKGAEFLQTDLDGLADDADLYAAGVNSHATVNLMLALEEAFDVEAPDRLLGRRTFSSIDAIAKALVEIGVKEDAAHHIAEDEGFCLAPGEERVVRLFPVGGSPAVPTAGMLGANIQLKSS